jgi:hypothetical protein
VAAILGAGCLALGLLERDLARAQESVAAADYIEPEATFDKAERYFQYASHLPLVGSGPANEVRARKAALKYWRRQYREVVPQQPDPVGSIPIDNTDLQLVVANAVYRTGQAQGADRESLMMAVETGINGYLSVLKNNPQRTDAAYNYEYLVRLRGELEKGPRKPAVAKEKGPDGEAGAPPESQNDPEFKLYVPLDREEREEAGEAGKAPPARRRG